MVTEIINELVAEVAADPMRMVAEVVQFVILVVIAWVVAVGTRKRRGFVANMLTEYESATHAQLDAAAKAQPGLIAARAAAGKTVRAGRADARRIAQDAKREAAEAETATCAAADAEAARIAARAEDALASELAEMQAQVRDELVDVVSEATRSILNERMTLGDQRRAIEDAVSGSLGDLAAPPPER